MIRLSCGRPGTRRGPGPSGATETEQPVRRTPRPGRRDEPLPALLRRTFEAARRELKSMVEKRKHMVKAHPEQQVTAVVESIFREKGYGFLRGLDGQQVYFHRNAVLHDHWEHLAVGTGVRFVASLGEKGLQASTVEPVDKRGEAEVHGKLHDVPGVSPNPVI